jgi:hypothetical protein
MCWPIAGEVLALNTLGLSGADFGEFSGVLVDHYVKDPVATAARHSSK